METEIHIKLQVEPYYTMKFSKKRFHLDGLLILYSFFVNIGLKWIIHNPFVEMCFTFCNRFDIQIIVHIEIIRHIG